MTDNDSRTYIGVTLFFSSQRGFGFLAWADENGVPQKDEFVHYSDLEMPGFKTLRKGDRVSFQIGKNNNGDPKATHVKLLKD